MARILCLAAALAACRTEPEAVEEPGLELRFVTYNVRRAKSASSAAETPSLAGVLETLEGLAPDVVALQELPLDQLERLARGLALPHHDGAPWRAGAPQGVAILSRWPILGAEAIELPGPGGRALRATLEVDGAELAVYSVHLSRRGISSSPGPEEIARELTTDNLRARQAARLVEVVRARPAAAAVLGGDLNAFPGSGAYRLLTGVLHDAFGPFEMLDGSFPMEELPDPKIDHVLLSENVVAVSAEVVEAGPSDHYPIVVVLRVPAPPRDRR